MSRPRPLETLQRLSRSPLVRYASGVVVAAGFVTVLVRAARSVSAGDIARVVQAANVRMLVAAVPVILTVGFVLRAARFDSVLRDARVPRPRFLETLGSVVVSQAANNVLPFRAGELVRTRDFLQRGFSLGRVAFAQLTEKGVELASLLVWTAPVLLRGFAGPRLVLGAILVLAALPGAALLFARRLRAARDSADEEASGSVRAGEPVGSADGWGRGRGWRATDVLRAFEWSLAADAAEVALIYVTLQSLGIAGGLPASIVVLAAVNLAIVLPSTPGQIGALEAGAALGLIALGVSREAALAFALLYRAVQWLPVTLAGAVVWLARPPLREARGESS